MKTQLCMILLPSCLMIVYIQKMYIFLRWDIKSNIGKINYGGSHLFITIVWHLKIVNSLKGLLIVSHTYIICVYKSRWCVRKAYIHSPYIFMGYSWLNYIHKQIHLNTLFLVNWLYKCFQKNKTYIASSLVKSLQCIWPEFYTQQYPHACKPTFNWSPL